MSGPRITDGLPGEAFLSRSGTEKATRSLKVLVELRAGYLAFESEAVAFALGLNDLSYWAILSLIH